MQEHKHRTRTVRLLLGAVALLLSLSVVVPALGEGSGTLYRESDPTRFRSNLEWRTGSYGGGDSPEFVLLRRTLLRVYMVQGETLSLGSSGIGVSGTPNNGNIRVLNPNQVTGTIGQEVIPALSGSPATPQAGAFANGFSCLAQRQATGDTARGRIGSRAQELAGPLPNANGYAPCVYTAPETGIYHIVFSGPSGENSNIEPRISGRLDPLPADFGPSQNTSVTAWDATVRSSEGTERTGRLFTYYYTAITGGGGRPTTGASYIVTNNGLRYRVVSQGDPFGFVFYSNQFGFQNSDGTPLYRDLLADPRASTQDQNELRQIQGNLRLLPPQYPLFLNPPDPVVLQALNLPLEPIVPSIRDFSFAGQNGGTSVVVGQGGTFSFTSTQAGSYTIVVSRDGTNFDPSNPANRFIQGVASAAGPVSVPWDGRDNTGEVFPPGQYLASTAVRGGEAHFPFLDVENNVRGGPTVELINPPDVNGDGIGDCPPWSGGCFGAFYDDRGYQAANGTLIGTAVGGPLCPGDAQNPLGFGRPPQIIASDPVLGYDTRTSQRGYGFPGPANPAGVCQRDGGFGDKKGLDLWTFYPSNILQTPLRIVAELSVTLQSFTASHANDQTVVRWQTASENGTLGFNLLRSETGNLADAVRITPSLIPAKGSPTSGASYSWTDSVRSDASYWLQEVETNGTTNVYGPVRARAGTTASGYRVLVPLAR